MRLWILSITFLLLAAPVWGANYYIPDDFPNIQDAISDQGVTHGDTIIVRPGVYYEIINLKGKNITLKSEQGPVVTIIDGLRSGTVVNIAGFEGPDCVVEGFTIRNGDFVWGGGLYCANSSPTIKGNSITGNYANKGGGIHLNNASPTITGNNIAGNYALEGSTFDGFGGGIYGFYSDATIVGNTITGNLIDTGYGAGLYFNNGAPVVKHNQISFNTILVDSGGGGLCCQHSTATVTGNLIFSNAAELGGGIYVNLADAVFTNNMIYANEAMWGGGIWCDGNILVVTNCTIIKNLVPPGKGGGGLFCLSDSVMKNSIVWNNAEYNLFGSLNPEITYSLIEGGWPGVGNMDADPFFVDPDNDDYHIPLASPCVNAGTKDGAPPFDFELDARPHMGAVDIGADEFTGALPLEADNFVVNASTGGTVNFNLAARPADAGRLYVMLGSWTGSSPGMTLPGGLILPVNYDYFTQNFVLPLLNTVVFTNFMTHLDGSGTGTAQLNVPVLNPAVAGISMYYAYAVGMPWDFASNPLQIDIEP
jgi:hypothetical protein